MGSHDMVRKLEKIVVMVKEYLIKGVEVKRVKMSLRSDIDQKLYKF